MSTMQQAPSAEPGAIQDAQDMVPQIRSRWTRS